MLPYVLLIGASLAGGLPPVRRPEYRRAYLLVMGLACWLTASLRHVTGFDYRFYESAFQSIAAQGLEGAGWSEPGYLLLNWAVSSLQVGRVHADAVGESGLSEPLQLDEVAQAVGYGSCGGGKGEGIECLVRRCQFVFAKIQ